MLQEMILYIRENLVTTALIAGGVLFFLLLVILIQVSRMKHEVHKICKKIRRYFEVVLDGIPETESEQDDALETVKVPVYQTTKRRQKEAEKQQTSEDAKLLMDVIQEVF